MKVEYNQYLYMLECQDNLNSKLHPEWRDQPWSHQAALAVEVGEVLNELHYKWWKEPKTAINWIGRSMEMRVGPPPGATLDEAFGSALQECADACPTGAIIVK